MVCLPASRVARLRGTVPSITDRRQIEPSTLTQFEKTACIIEKSPWSMSQAATYLRGFVDNNRAKKQWKPPIISWIWDPTIIGSATSDADRVPGNLNPARLPQRVAVAPKFKAAKWKAGSVNAKSTAVVAPPAAMRRPASAPANRPEQKVRKVRNVIPTDLVAIPKNIASRLGCSKCRNTPVGCKTCRALNHVSQADDGSLHYNPE